MSQPDEFTYADAGVDIDAQDDALARIKAHVRSAATPGVLSGIGHFGGLFRPEFTGLEDPVLVSSMDGVGSKLKIAIALDRHDTVGCDIVNHCVDDILVTGARPLFFLDYIGTGKVRPGIIEQIVKGVATGCRESGCALVGGEIAELPETYAEGDYDLVGTIVGVVERGGILDGSAVRKGDVLVGLESNGLHTNGYTLVRKVLLDRMGLSLDQHVDELGRTVGEELLRIHRSYAGVVDTIRADVEIRAMAHLTGGGFLDNIPRVLPEGLGARVRPGSWPVQPIFEILRREANLSMAEAHRTFNMGVGLVLVVPPDHADRAVAIAEAAGVPAWVVGEVLAGPAGVELAAGD